jgi:hypothetical protein
MITGTYLDEISHDVGSANWGPEEWTRDFASMKADGIDAVILHRAGRGDRATFDSRVLRKVHPHLLVQEDLVALFLALAAEHRMSFWFGLHEAVPEARDAGHARECDVNRALIDEVWERYGRSSAFRGWHLPAEIDPRDDSAARAREELCAHVRAVSALPILAAVRLRPARTPAERVEMQRAAAASLAFLRPGFDVVAFRDGGVALHELPDALASAAEIARAGRLTAWADLESFDREARLPFAPIAWPKLRFKIESALAAGFDKVVTYEYGHFLSPNSAHGSAHALHRRYREWLATQR